MAMFNRIIAALLWFFLLVAICALAIIPLQTIQWLQQWLTVAALQIQAWKATNPDNFIIAQATIGVTAILLFGILLWVELWGMRNRGVRIRTAAGGLAELDTASIGRRLEWHLEQVAEVNTVVPTVRAKGGAVDIRLEIEVTPEVDIPTKTDEVVALARDVVEEDIGLTLGKLDVQMRCAPFEPSLAGS
ncbi:MAG: hypothetical protein KF832_20265 [Caldilineaceae bacterium]|nr:hypothetical protein [Caldilineaceae bacterium]